MGVWFNDPDIEMDEIFWYNILAQYIYNSTNDRKGLVSVDPDFGTQSCYVELHRNGLLI